MTKRKNVKEKDLKRHLWLFVFLIFLIIFVAWLINLKVLFFSKPSVSKDSLFTEVKNAVYNLETSFRTLKNFLPPPRGNSLSNQEIEKLKEKVLEKAKNQ